MASFATPRLGSRRPHEQGRQRQTFENGNGSCAPWHFRVHARAAARSHVVKATLLRFCLMPEEGFEPPTRGL